MQHRINTKRSANTKFEPELECKALPKVPQLASFCTMMMDFPR
jgi:hypothetical protein